jgi:hypothetical protein
VARPSIETAERMMKHPVSICLWYRRADGGQSCAFLREKAIGAGLAIRRLLSTKRRMSPKRPGISSRLFLRQQLAVHRRKGSHCGGAIADELMAICAKPARIISPRDRRMSCGKSS